MIWGHHRHTYTYDANGNQTKGGTPTSTWNTFDQLASHNTTSFTYAGQGNIERFTAGGISFLNGSLGITQQANAGGTASNICDPAGTLVSMHNSAGASFYYATDALGSTILLTDSVQAKAATYLYDSWGNTTTQTGTQAAANPCSAHRSIRTASTTSSSCSECTVACQDS